MRSTACCGRIQRSAPTTKQSKWKSMAVRAHVLPDLLRPGLAVVFCGTAAGNASAARSAYYAHPQNKFWRILYDIRLTPRLLQARGICRAAAMGLRTYRHRQACERDGPRAAARRAGTRSLRDAGGQDQGGRAENARLHQSYRGAAFSPAREPASAIAASASARPEFGFCPRPRRRPAGTGTPHGGACSPRK